MNDVRVTGVAVYPVKSCAPITPEHATVGPRGLDFDRRWMLVNAGGETLTGREFPGLLKVKTEIREGRLLLQAPAMPDLEITECDEGPRRRVFVFEDPCEATGCGARVDQWFRDYLGTECHLVHMGPDCRREVSADCGGRPGDEVSFADECPLLLTSEASLADLDARAPIQVTMGRFRPNLVVRGAAAPYDEDHWRRVRIGTIEFDCAQACRRCVFTTIDPESAVRHEHQEPLRTLSTYRRFGPGGPAFGIHLIPRGEGVVRPGDRVEIVARG